MAGGKMESKLYAHSAAISACMAQAGNLAATAVLSACYHPFNPSSLIIDPLLSITHSFERGIHSRKCK